MRVPGLPIRDCAISSKKLVPRVAQVSAIDVTEKTIFERLYLVPGLRQFAPRVNCPCAPTPPPLTERLFLDFRVIVFSRWALIFLVSMIRQVIWPSPGTLGDIAF